MPVLALGMCLGLVKLYLCMFIKTKQKKQKEINLLHCALAAAQCIVIGPVCVFAAGGRAGGRASCVCVCVCGSVTTIT